MLAVLLGLALCIGVVTAIVTAGLPAFLPMVFTPDRRLWPLMRTVAPQVFITCMPDSSLIIDSWTRAVTHLPARLAYMYVVCHDAVWHTMWLHIPSSA